MFKITSKVIGSITIEGKELGYNAFTFVSKQTPEIIDMQGSKLIKVEFIKDSNTNILQPIINDNIGNRKNKKQNNNGGI